MNSVDDGEAALANHDDATFLGALAFANLRQQSMPYVLDAW
jgi:hypothetical protein